MRTKLVCTLLALSAIACGTVMSTLEDATDANSVEGKLIRGANRLRKSFQDLDPSEEHFIGRSVAAEILALPRYPLADDESQLAYVERVGHGIVATNDDVLLPFLDYRFGILATDEVNAFACPGGLILVTRGLLAAARTEDELAAVLAHEVAHVTLRHGVAAIKQANLTAAFGYLGAGAAQATLSDEDMAKLTDVFDDSVSDIVQTLVTSGYSRDAELAADQLARQFLAGTGYDPQGLARVLGRMSSSGAGGMLATHPAPEDRIEALGSPLAYVADAAATAKRDARHAAVFAH
jgi:predicted Zn-dependent protease